MSGVFSIMREAKDGETVDEHVFCKGSWPLRFRHVHEHLVTLEEQDELV